jgi:hypothetical protein
MVKCPRCARPITWARAAGGTLLAVEPVYHYHLVATGPGESLPRAERQPESILVSHFLRCPATDETGKLPPLT